MAGNKSSIFRFADVEVREREFSLVKAGEVLAVEPKAFRVLLMLLRNPQKLIAKEELLNAVWGDAAVTENSLTRSIALLRRLLGDEARDPRFIETVATVGYRWVCKVEVAEDVLGEAETAEAPGNLSGAGKKVGSRKLLWGWVLAGGGMLALCLAGVIWYLHRPLPPPRITGYTQITHDGRMKELRGADGSRIYFTQMLNPETPVSVAQASISGGEIAQIPVALANIELEDVSSDGSAFLITSSSSGDWILPALWNVRILGGSVRRLGDAFSAAFSPDGNSVAYCAPGGEIWLVRSDGTGAHKLASAGGNVSDIAWSPDGRVIRLTVDDRIWEMASNGSNVHQLFPGWRPSSARCCGRWTPDGRFFVFLSEDQIWALDERRGLLRQPSAAPVQLTSGPLRWGRPVPGKDGTRIFAEGNTPHGEISRFDGKSKQFQPFLGGISAQGMSFSRDGKSVAYVSYPEGILWKADRDGSNPVRLSDPPIQAFLPRLSPDGKQIVFTDLVSADSYIVSTEGGSPRKVLPDDRDYFDGPPSWSPDGHKIVFFSLPAGAPWAPSKCLIRILDLDTHKISTVPGSDGMPGALWSPDGRYLLGGGLAT